MELSQPLSLLLVSGAVALLPGISRTLGAPASVAEILFGVLLGKSVLQLSFSGDWLPFLAELGFLVLMFHAGMEINFSMLRKQGKRQLIFQAGLFCATLGLSVLVAQLLGRGVFLSLVLTTTSLGLVMPTLRESKASATPLGQTILIAATLADFLTLLGITVYVLLHQYGASLRLLAPVPLFVGFAALLWLARLWAWWNPDQAAKFLSPDDSREQGVRISLALLFLFVALSELAHLEPVLGAFMGGCIISFVFREKEILESKISAIGFGFLTPLFFIHVGMNFNIANVLRADMLMLVVQLIIAAFAVKMIPCMGFPLFGLSLKDGMKAGLLLSSRLSLIVAAASIGVSEGFITIQTKDAIVLLALITCFLGPTLFKLAYGQPKHA